MKHLILAGAALLTLVACVNEEKANAAQETSETKAPDDDSIQTGSIALDTISKAILNPARSQEARDRDTGRKPAAVLRLADIQPGQTVVDIASSPDYYAPLLADVVGPDGELIMIGPKRLEEFFPQALDAADAYGDASDDDNIISLRMNLDEITLDTPADRVLNILYYHDTVWSGVDRAKMNKAIFDALKPGGYYLIIDHAAKAGAGDAVTNDLHRIDPAVVRPEIEAAGFTLVKESDLLANPDDPMEEGVFGPLRGKTNRFVMLFQKPE